MQKILTLIVATMILFMSAFVTISARAEENHAQNWVAGFERIIDGKPFSYHSPQPDVTSSLLIRASKGINETSWESERVPDNIESDYVTFVWMFGIKVSSQQCDFHLYVDGKKYFTFKNPQTTDTMEWSVTGPGESTLRFKASTVDRYNDLMGYASVKLPKKIVRVGEPVRFKMMAEEAGSSVWYMTFIEKLDSSVKMHPRNAVLNDGDNAYRPVSIGIVHLSEPTKAVINVDGNVIERDLEFGYNSIMLKMPMENKDMLVEVNIPGMDTIQLREKLQPIKKWTVYLVTHSHTDIGYTRPQSEILPEHLRFIDYALDYCDLTDDYPEDSRFKWTCEVSWPVSEYLKRRPQSQIDRLVKRIKEGRIEVAGMYLNYSEILDENLLASQLKPLKRLRDAGIDVKAAIQDDVNGIGWSLVDYFNDIGLKYVNMGEHGHRAIVPFDKPTAFWWESPSGKRVLAFRPDHYMTGNSFGIHTGRLNVFEDNLFSYFESLSERDYPFSEISIQYSGYLTDNSPPSTLECEVIREWNEKYEWPKLRTATVSEFLELVEEKYGNDIDVKRTAWPDWWTDGFGSAARETAVARKTSSELIAIKGLLSMAHLMGEDISMLAHHDIDDIENDLLFYGEHTFGAAESVTDPTCENSVVQWGEKSSYAWEAFKKSRILQEHAMGLLTPHVPKSTNPSIVIFNTMNWERSGIATLYIDHQLIPPGKSFTIVDCKGHEVPVQASHSRSDGTYWKLYVDDVPAMGYKCFEIKVKDEQKGDEKIVDSNSMLENSYYGLKFDEESGAVVSLYDKELDREFVDASCKWNLGQLIYEEIYNRHQLEKFMLNEFDRTTIENVTMEPGIDGPIWKSIKVKGDLKGCAEDGVMYEIRLFKPEKRIDINYSIRKLPITEPEAVYVAFPFKADGEWKIQFEAQGGIVQPGVDQLEGTSSDWSTIQNFAVMRDENSQVVLGSDEIPLMHLGGINLGEFKYIADPDNPHMFSWVLNNYWVTNFKASQEGELIWNYYLTTTGDQSDMYATRFGWSARVPMLGRVFPPANTEARKEPGTLLKIDADNVLLVNSQPCRDGVGLTLHLREIEGEETSFRLPGYKIKRVNVFGETLEELDNVKLKPYESAFYRIEK